MTTSFNVNKGDLAFILKQIQVSDLHAGTNGPAMSLTAAIQQIYGLSATDAALAPFGLRTVDGQDNNLLAGQAEFGAADNPFPRLVDPVYRNEGDEAPFVGVTNTNYGAAGDVVDSDPRTISNLIVDMTSANPAAVSAALAYHGIFGADATAASAAILAAYQLTKTTDNDKVAAQAAETAAQAALTTETTQQAAAAAADAAAQATLAAYTAAHAQDVEVKVAAAQLAVAALVTSLGSAGDPLTGAALSAAADAVAAATVASTAAAAAYATLLSDPNALPADLTAAQAVASSTAALLTQVTSVQTALVNAGPDVDAPELAAAETAGVLAGDNASAASANSAQLVASQTAAANVAIATAAALVIANGELSAAQSAYTAAATASDNADTAAAAAQAAENAAFVDLAASMSAQGIALAANNASQATLAAYNTALLADAEGKAAGAQTPVDTLVNILGTVGSTIDQTDLDNAAAAVAAASLASTAASAAVIALASNPAVVADDLTDAQTVETNAALLLTQLTALELALNTDGVLDAGEFQAAQDASALTGDNASAASANSAQLVASQTAAATAAGTTAAALFAADAQVAQDISDRDAAIAASVAADGVAADKQVLEDAAYGVLQTEITEQAAAVAANDAAQATEAAYALGLAQDVEVKSAAAQVASAALTASLGLVGDLINAADLSAATAAVAAASLASTAASAAVTALASDPDVVADDLSDAQAAATNAALLLAQLTSLQTALNSGPDVHASDLAAAQAANVLAAGIASSSLNPTLLVLSANAAATAAALADANAELSAAQSAYTAAQAASNAADVAEDNADVALTDSLTSYGIEQGPEGALVIPNLSPDIGLSPGFNAWMTFFGQFFDHGLDLVTKGGNGTVYVPLQADDPLIAGADGVFGTTDDLAPHLRFMALTRATPTLVDPDGAGPLPAAPQHENTTTSFVDQNQTYTSHASHQVFLREYRLSVDGPDAGTVPDSHAVATGRLLDGTAASGSLDGAIGNWAEVKAQALEMLGIRLTDLDVHNVPLLKTDQYGKFIPGANGYAQIVMAPDVTHATNWFKEGTAAGITTDGSIGTGHAFLNDIAHHAAPGRWDSNGDHVVNGLDAFQVADSDPGVGDDHLASTYDDEMLDAHFVTGDGRGNENIALTAVHSIFHSEHNRLVEANKQTILEAANEGDIAFLNEWLLVDVASVPANVSSLVWDGERLFQAARFVTEMQYQHLVFEEFARRVQPNVDPFVFTQSADVDASILAEFAHVVYRFGHSMLTDTVDRLDNDLTTVNGDTDQATLIEAFLNPQMYVGTGVDLAATNGAIIRGLSRDLGNEMDEFIVPAVRSNLLGLPLDLAALNIARGRETGIPSLNDTRAQLYDDFGAADLKPYTSWADFAQHLKTPLSIVNFIAAYGTHSTITGATTLEGKRAAAMELVLGTDQGVGAPGVPADRIAFLNATGAYAGGSLGGLNNVDLWIGGLAEEKNEFGGMLGSTFNFIFEFQMERLQNGDRLYYLSRTQGLNLLNQLEPNSFTDLIMRNTDLGDLYSTHLNGSIFVTPDHILELDRGIAQDGADPEHDDPFLQEIDPKAMRDYTGATTLIDNKGTATTADDVTHDVGGTLRVSGGEHYVLGGTEGNDRLYGDKGIDTLWGDGGNDYLNAGMESDDVFGGEGDDIIEDPFGDDVLRGNQGNDVISGGVGIDLLFGDQGKDYIIMGQDAAEAFAGSGDDFVLGGVGQDFLLGNEGNDWIEGGDGFDTIAGENSELFFNSPVIGHDVLWGQGNDQDYDAESGDDIMLSGPGIQRFEGMFGFDWAIAKHDPNGGKFDFQIPIFTNIPTDILKDRFDQVEAGSGWIHNDILEGDDRGHKGGGSSAPDSVPTELFADHVLTQEGIDRITGLNDWFAGARQTLFGAGVPGAQQSSYRDGNILMGGDGSDVFRGRGGYDILDGDAWLNVRISIDMGNGLTYSAESMNTDTAVGGALAGRVTNAAGIVQFGGQSLSSLMLNGTLNPGQLSIVREIKYDGTDVSGANMNIDTAAFQGTLAEYDIEGRGTIVGGVEQRAFDLNGDGFISVRDRDTGAVGATVEGVVLGSRGALTDDTDLLRNIEHLQFADQTIAIGGTNSLATGTVTIGDPTPYDDDNNAATPATVTPYVGQVLTATLTNLVDANGVPMSGGNPVGLTYEWQTTEIGSNAGWATIQTSLTYTVRSVDPGHILRAVAVFKDSNGVTERIVSANTEGPTVAFSVLENSPAGTIVGLQIPFSVDYDPLAIGGVPPVDVDLATLVHYIQPGQDAGGRFTVVENGVDANDFPRYSLVVAPGGTALLDYEAVQGPVDNQYQVVIDSYSDTIENGGVLVVSRQFNVFLGDVDPEGPPPIPPTDIVWNGIRPASETALPGSAVPIATLSTVDPDNSPITYSKEAGSDPSIVVSGAGTVSRTGGLGTNTTYVLAVKATETAIGGASILESFNIRTGSTGNNTIAGSGLTDIIYGLGGNDTLNGLAGSDTLFGQDGNDTLNGGSGNDDLTGGNNNDTINGDAGKDTIRYMIGDDSDNVNGGGNIDTLVITGTGGSETLDVVFNGTTLTDFEGGTVVNVESVTADLSGGTSDALSYAGSTAAVTVNLTTGTASGFTSIAGIENVTGGSGNDTLTGVAGQANALTGGTGNDTFVVHDTTDTVSESNGNGGGTDTVQFQSTTAASTYTITDSDVENLTLLETDNINGTGNASANVITGNSGNNLLNGADGNDTLIGGLGINTLNGGNNTDTASYAAASAGVTVSLAVAGAQNSVGAGTDTLVSIENLLGSAFNDTLTASGTGAAGIVNLLSGNNGNDTLTATVDNVRDTLDGGNGSDTANYAAYGAALTVNLGGAAPIIVVGSGSTAANSDVLVGIENFIGGSGNNVLTGSGAANILSGGGGNDNITGGGGNDTLSGGANNDTFIYNMGDGADAVDGGANNDTLNIVANGGNDTLDIVYNGTLLTQVESGSVTNVETINASMGGGTDTLSYAGSTSSITVNLGLATPTASGFTTIASVENVIGGSGVDTLTGSAGANTLNGGAGNDTLNGGVGGDILLGGIGADTINTGAANDNVQDILRFSATTEFGDIVTNFDADGTDGVDDRVEFSGALNSAYDDGNSNDNILFASGNGGAGTVNATVGQGNGDVEALLLTGAGGEGVTTANLANAALVSAAFNSEFVLSALNGEDALLVVNDTDGNSFSVWEWDQAGGGETSAAEISLVGIFTANATVTTGNFDFI